MILTEDYNEILRRASHLSEGTKNTLKRLKKDYGIEPDLALAKRWLEEKAKELYKFKTTDRLQWLTIMNVMQEANIGQNTGVDNGERDYQYFNLRLQNVARYLYQDEYKEIIRALTELKSIKVFLVSMNKNYNLKISLKRVITEGESYLKLATQTNCSNKEVKQISDFFQMMDEFKENYGVKFLHNSYHEFRNNGYKGHVKIINSFK